MIARYLLSEFRHIRKWALYMVRNHRICKWSSFYQLTWMWGLFFRIIFRSRQRQSSWLCFRSWYCKTMIDCGLSFHLYQSKQILMVFMSERLVGPGLTWKMLWVPWRSSRLQMKWNLLETRSVVSWLRNWGQFSKDMNYEQPKRIERAFLSLSRDASAFNAKVQIHRRAIFFPITHDIFGQNHRLEIISAALAHEQSQVRRYLACCRFLKKAVCHRRFINALDKCWGRLRH